MHSASIDPLNDSSCFLTFLNFRKTPILVALAIITLSGIAMNLLGFFSYLPHQTIWIGGLISIGAVISAAIVCATIKFNHVPQGLRAYDTEKTKAAYRQINQLVKQGQVVKAWKNYHETAYEERFGMKLSDEQKIDPVPYYQLLPSEKLLNAVVDDWISKEILPSTQISAALLRECAKQYPNFSMKCLENKAIWQYLNLYPTYIAEIAAFQPSFGLQIMLSQRGEDIFDDLTRMAIFHSSYPCFIKKIKTKELDELAIKYFGKFMMNNHSLILTEDFERLVHISQALKEKRGSYFIKAEDYKKYSRYIALIDLVSGKLSFQGIYQKETISNCCFSIDIDLYYNRYTLEGMERWMREIEAASNKESLRKGLFYLTTIDTENDHWIDAQIMLGKIWMDLGNMAKAKFYFLRARGHQLSPDVLKLVAVCSFAIVEEDGKCFLILREIIEELKNRGIFPRPLDPQKCQWLTLDDLINTIEELKPLKYRPPYGKLLS